MDANKLKLNDSNTEFMIIKTTKKTEKVQVKSIEIGESTIKPSKKVRNIGVQMHSELSMAEQFMTVNFQWLNTFTKSVKLVISI